MNLIAREFERLEAGFYHGAQVAAAHILHGMDPNQIVAEVKRHCAAKKQEIQQRKVANN